MSLVYATTRTQQPAAQDASGSKIDQLPRKDTKHGCEWGDFDAPLAEPVELTQAEKQALKRKHGSTLPNFERCRNVKRLALEGYSVTEIATLLVTGRRQVAKDHAALLSAGLVKPSKIGATKSVQR